MTASPPARHEPGEISAPREGELLGRPTSMPVTSTGCHLTYPHGGIARETSAESSRQRASLKAYRLATARLGIHRLAGLPLPQQLAYTWPEMGAHLGREYYGAIGIWVGFAKNTGISHNLVHDLPYTGVSVGWEWGLYPDTRIKNNLVKFNHIYDVFNQLCDGGYIYTLGYQPGTVIRDNHLHHANRKSKTKSAPCKDLPCMSVPSSCF